MGALLESDGCCYNRSFDAAGPPQDSFAFHKAIGDAFFFTGGREGHHYFQGVAVCSHYHQLDFALAHGLKYFVDAFFDLTEGEQLLQEF